MYIINGSQFHKSGNFNYKNINYTIYYHEKTNSQVEHIHIGIKNSLITCILFDLKKNSKFKLLEVTNNLDNDMAKLIGSMKKDGVIDCFKDLFLTNMNIVKNL
jgi:hypothetical protein